MQCEICKVRRGVANARDRVTRLVRCAADRVVRLDDRLYEHKTQLIALLEAQADRRYDDGERFVHLLAQVSKFLIIKFALCFSTKNPIG